MPYQVYQITHEHEHGASTRIVVVDAQEAPPQAADFQLSDPATYELHCQGESLAIERVEGLEPAINRLAELEPEGEVLRQLLSDAQPPGAAWWQFEAIEGTFDTRPVAGGVIAGEGLDIAGASAAEVEGYLYVRRPADGAAYGPKIDPRDPDGCSYHAVALSDVNDLSYYADEPPAGPA